MGLRGLRQAALGVGSPRTEEIGLQGVPEQALPEGRRGKSPGAEPGADAAGATTESTRDERSGGEAHFRTSLASLAPVSSTTPWLAPMPGPHA